MCHLVAMAISSISGPPTQWSVGRQFWRSTWLASSSISHFQIARLAPVSLICSIVSSDFSFSTSPGICSPSYMWQQLVPFLLFSWLKMTHENRNVRIHHFFPRHLWVTEVLINDHMLYESGVFQPPKYFAVPFDELKVNISQLRICYCDDGIHRNLSHLLVTAVNHFGAQRFRVIYVNKHIIADLVQVLNSNSGRLFLAISDSYWVDAIVQQLLNFFQQDTFKTSILVVPYRFSSSWDLDSSTLSLAISWSTSIMLRMLASSLFTVTSPPLSTIIIFSVFGPNDICVVFATALAAMIWDLRASNSRRPDLQSWSLKWERGAHTHLRQRSPLMPWWTNWNKRSPILIVLTSFNFISLK